LNLSFPRIERYIPGVAFLYGFSQENERNPGQEVSATVVAAWTDSVEVKIKLPEYTVYKAVSFPVLWDSQWTYHNMTDSTLYQVYTSIKTAEPRCRPDV
ncbi:hypothetical protein AMECASPLE_031435, partial [Ameca splendens]